MTEGNVEIYSQDDTALLDERAYQATHDAKIRAAAQKEVWEKMRMGCGWKVAGLCERLPGTCAFDACPLLKEEGG